MPASDAQLYTGVDLANAAARSTVRSSVRDRLHGIGNAVRVFADVVQNRPSHPRGSQFQFVVASGRAPEGTELTAVYAGTGANRSWCLSSAFTQYHETEVRSCDCARECLDLLARSAGDANFLFTDGVPPAMLDSFDRPYLRMPAWVKQRLRIEDTWEEQLTGMRRGTRQEIVRMLRRYGYKCRLTRARGDFDRFYSGLYIPYVTGRFGKGAVTVDEARFLRECRRGTLLQLLHDQTVVGGALLRRVGDTMAIVWSALNPCTAGPPMRGITDTMDYFSVLFAYLKACRWLDFGPSRPDLYDGALRYKRKWGTHVAKGLVSQPTVTWSCTGLHHEEEAAFLARHAVLQCIDGKLVATAFLAEGAAPDSIRPAVQLLTGPGIERSRIIALAPLADDVRRALAGSQADMTIHEAHCLRDAIAAAGE